MRYVRLGGLEVSVVALGCGNFGGVGSAPEFFGQGENEEQAGELLDAAVEAGVTLLDTADSYGGGRSEEWLGRWLVSRGVRDEMVITTKVGNQVPAGRGLSAAHLRGQIDESLRRLRTDRVDLYLTHAPDPSTPIGETVTAFDELVLAGKIREYGFSNLDAGQVSAAVEAADGLHPPVNLQIGHSVVDQADPETLKACVSNNIGVTAYSPLAGGWLARDYRPGEPYPAGSRMTLRPEPYADIEHKAGAGVIDALRAEATSRGLSLPVLALGWVLADPAITAVIVGPRNPAHLAPAIAALDHSLDPADHAHLTSLGNGQR
jgi:aryl-alcohol dehydrogenase-like predicted oxidoreductase